MKKIIFIQFMVIIGLVFLVLAMRGCDKAKLSAQQSTIDSLTLANQRIDSIKNELAQTVTVQEVIVTNSKDEIGRLTDDIYNLKKQNERQIKQVVAYYKGIINTTLKDINIPYIDTTDTIPELKDAECEVALEYYKTHTVVVPKIVSDSTKDYQVDMTVTKQGVTINNLIIPDSQYVRFVNLKGGFLKRDQQGKRHLFLKQTVQVQVLHTSPFVQVTGGNSVIYQAKKKRNLVGKALLIGAGVYLGTRL